MTMAAAGRRRFASKVAQVVALRNTYVSAAFFSPLLLSQVGDATPAPPPWFARCCQHTRWLCSATHRSRRAGGGGGAHTQGVSTLFQTRFPVSTVHWSRSVAAARRDGLLQTLPDGSLTLHCEEVCVCVCHV